MDASYNDHSMDKLKPSGQSKLVIMINSFHKLGFTVKKIRLL